MSFMTTLPIARRSASARLLSSKGSLYGTSAILLALALLLTGYSSQHPEMASSLGGVVRTVVYPFEASSAWLTNSLEGAWSSYLVLRDAQEENELLRTQIAQLRAKNTQLQEAFFENERLKTLLSFKEERDEDALVAQVIGTNLGGWQKTLTVNRGSDDQVVVGTTVATSEGLVGQVVAVGKWSSLVVLLTDPLSGVDAVIEKTRARGVLEGTGAQDCELSFVSSGETVAVGERVVSSGIDDVFPKGLVLGTVVGTKDSSSKTFKVFQVRPAVDFSRIEEVLLLRKEKKKEDLVRDIDQKEGK